MFERGFGGLVFGVFWDSCEFGVSWVLEFCGFWIFVGFGISVGFGFLWIFGFVDFGFPLILGFLGTWVFVVWVGLGG